MANLRAALIPDSHRATVSPPAPLPRQLSVTPSLPPQPPHQLTRPSVHYLIPFPSLSQLTALFRVPFNVLVTLALVLGLESHRKGFLVVSGGALLVAAAVAGRIARRAGGCDVKLA